MKNPFKKKKEKPEPVGPITGAGAAFLFDRGDGKIETYPAFSVFLRKTVGRLDQLEKMVGPISTIELRAGLDELERVQKIHTDAVNEISGRIEQINRLEKIADLSRSIHKLEARIEEIDVARLEMESHFAEEIRNIASNVRETHKARSVLDTRISGVVEMIAALEHQVDELTERVENVVENAGDNARATREKIQELERRIVREGYERQQLAERVGLLLVGQARERPETAGEPTTGPGADVSLKNDLAAIMGRKQREIVEAFRSDLQAFREHQNKVFREVYENTIGDAVRSITKTQKAISTEIDMIRTRLDQIEDAIPVPLVPESEAGSTVRKAEQAIMPVASPVEEPVSFRQHKLTAADAAGILQVSVSTIHRYVRKSLIRRLDFPFKHRDGRVWFSGPAVRQWLAESESNQAAGCRKRIQERLENIKANVKGPAIKE